MTQNVSFQVSGADIANNTAAQGKGIHIYANGDNGNDMLDTSRVIAVQPGKSVSFEVALPDGYKVLSVTATAGSGNVTGTGASYTYAMSGTNKNAVIITVTVESEAAVQETINDAKTAANKLLSLTTDRDKSAAISEAQNALSTLTNPSQAEVNAIVTDLAKTLMGDLGTNITSGKILATDDTMFEADYTGSINPQIVKGAVTMNTVTVFDTSVTNSTDQNYSRKAVVYGNIDTNTNYFTANGAYTDAQKEAVANFWYGNNKYSNDQRDAIIGLLLGYIKDGIQNDSVFEANNNAKGFTLVRIPRADGTFRTSIAIVAEDANGNRSVTPAARDTANWDFSNMTVTGATTIPATTAFPAP